MARRTLYDFSADTGIVMPDTDDVREGIVTDFKCDGTANNPGIFGPNCDTSEETHVGRFIDEITELVVQTTGINVQNANQFNLNFATETFLDNHGAAIGVPRLGRSQTQVTVMLSSSGKGTVKAGTVFESEDEYEFALVSDVVLDDSSAVTVEGETSYVATGTAAAVEYGRIYCPAGALKTVKTLVALDVSDLTVTNAAAESELGREEETDAHYRTRIKAALDRGGVIPSNQYFVRVYYRYAYGTLPTPTRSGYSFQGWFTDIYRGSQVSSATTIGTDDVTIYAHWNEPKYTITFNPNGGNCQRDI